MEYGLWRLSCGCGGAEQRVLILVLMEYGLWRVKPVYWTGYWCVLILVLMEYGLWHYVWRHRHDSYSGLNPCSNGIWSLTLRALNASSLRTRLNPCSNGIWSLTRRPRARWWSPQGRLNPCSNGIWSLTQLESCWKASKPSLNPCSNGIWSLTSEAKDQGTQGGQVLILVLMEYGLWHWYRWVSE